MARTGGPKPIPTALKIAKGTLNVTRDAKLGDELQVQMLNEIPEPPRNFISEQGKRIWETLCRELSNNGILANVDLDLVFSYAYNMELYYECLTRIEQEGYTQTSQSGFSNPHPCIGTMNQALKNALNVGQLFGLTPSARTRIATNAKEKKNPLLELAEKKAKTA